MGSVPTLIGAETSFQGEINSSDSICIQGTFQGKLHSSGNVYINQSAWVQADIEAQYVAVHGTVQGNILAHEELNLGTTGRISGDVHTGTLTVNTGGILDGCCRMDNPQAALSITKELDHEVQPAPDKQTVKNTDTESKPQ